MPSLDIETLCSFVGSFVASHEDGKNNVENTSPSTPLRIKNKHLSRGWSKSYGEVFIFYSKWCTWAGINTSLEDGQNHMDLIS